MSPIADRDDSAATVAGAQRNGDDGAAGDATETREGLDQTLADSDQTASDTDHTASETDQAASGSDQELADRDQKSADRDQLASDRDQAAAGPSDPAHDASRADREVTTRERDATAAERSRTTAQRLAAAAGRDEVADARDRAADVRDRAADQRDRAADGRDAAADAREGPALNAGTLDDAAIVVRELRLRAAGIRQRSAQERAAAARDRVAAAEDRRRAAADRSDAGLDELTGVFRRGTGELAVAHEISRARRLDLPMILVMLDVDGLKRVNDTHGHAAGDALLQDVPRAITAALRSYDVIVRWGGDEFVCALSDVTPEVAEERLGEIESALQALQPGSSISAGWSMLRDDDTLESVVSRADAELYRRKAGRRS